MKSIQIWSIKKTCIVYFIYWPVFFFLKNTKKKIRIKKTEWKKKSLRRRTLANSVVDKKVIWQNIVQLFFYFITTICFVQQLINYATYLIQSETVLKASEKMSFFCLLFFFCFSMVKHIRGSKIIVKK